MYEPLNILILVSQSSLCEMIIQELPKAKQEKTAQESWFIRWLWRTTGGAALYALAACLVSAVSERCCLLTSSTQTNHTNGGEGKCGPGLLMFGRCCGSSEGDMSVDNAESGVGTSCLLTLRLLLLKPSSQVLTHGSSQTPRFCGQSL